MPGPRGLVFVITSSVDEYHSGDTFMRISRTGFLIYLNSTPVYWMYKKRTSFESLSFFSEFVAMIFFCEYISGLQ